MRVSLPGGGEADLSHLLDNVWGCWPEEELLAFRVGEAAGVLRPGRSRVELARGVAGPGAFLAELEVEVPGLRVEWKAGGVKVHLRARVWSIGAKGDLAGACRPPAGP